MTLRVALFVLMLLRSFLLVGSATGNYEDDTYTNCETLRFPSPQEGPSRQHYLLDLSPAIIYVLLSPPGDLFKRHNLPLSVWLWQCAKEVGSECFTARNRERICYACYAQMFNPILTATVTKSL